MSKADRIKRERKKAAEAAPRLPNLHGESWDEFAARLTELAAAHVFVGIGLRGQSEQFMEFMASTEGKGQSVGAIPVGPWNGPMPTYGTIPINDALASIAPGGRYEALLGHMWAVTVSAEWEHYRPRIAKDMDEAPLNDARFADLYKFRNDIVHNHGVARDKSGKAEVFGNWIKVGQEIVIGEKQIVAFMDKLGLVEWQSQKSGEEMLSLMEAVERQRKQLGADMLHIDVSRRKCPRCKLVGEWTEAKCPKCGFEPTRA